MRGGPLAVIHTDVCTVVQAHPQPVQNQQELEDHGSPQRVGKNSSSGKVKVKVIRLVAVSPGQESTLFFAWCPPGLCLSGL